MKKIALLTVVFAAAVALQSHTARAAQTTDVQTWVSATGDDSNTASDCQEAVAPCQSFHAALSQLVSHTGHVSCAGPAEDIATSATSISFSVIIDCTPGWGKYMAAFNNTNGLVINAAGHQITLRGLYLDGINTPGFGGPFGLTGILIQAAAAVDIEDCVIENWAQSGIAVATSANTIVNIKNTSIKNSTNGISFTPTAGAVNGTIDHSKITKISGDGITASGAAYFTVTNSTISNVAAVGVSSGAGAVLEVDSSSVSNNNTAFATSGGIIRVSRNVIYDNHTNFSIAGGTIATSGDNNVAVNGSTVPNGTITRQ